MRLTLFVQKGDELGYDISSEMVNDDLLDSPWISAACKIQGDLNQVL